MLLYYRLQHNLNCRKFNSHSFCIVSYIERIKRFQPVRVAFGLNVSFSVVIFDNFVGFYQQFTDLKKKTSIEESLWRGSKKQIEI